MTQDDRTRRRDGFARHATDGDPIHALRMSIAAVLASPRDPQARAQLRVLADEQDSWDQLALLLADEVRRHGDDREIAVACYEELAEVHDHLDQPLESIAAMEAVIALAPDDVDPRDRLARMYRRAGAWAKAAEMFEQVASLLEVDDRAREALDAAARLYREHGRLDRAVAAYRALVARDPVPDVDTPHVADAWRALDELLVELGLWREVAELRGVRASRADADVDVAALLRAQARALEHAGDPIAAAELVARAAAYAPESVSALVDYATVLARAGHGREAADILAARVAEAIERAGDSSRARRDAHPTSADDVTALRWRLAELLDVACGDRPAAAAVLEQLLDDTPDHLPALEQLVRYAADAGEPRSHADALLRHAAALSDPADRAVTVLAAARRLRDARDHRAAAHAFETATELLPDDDGVRRELEQMRIAIAIEAAGVAAVGGDRPSAERSLRAILRTRPHHVDANLALVELLPPVAAADHLRAMLATAPEITPPQQLAPLVHRCALAVAACGDADEAHRLLHEAHRLDRRSLAIKLALGDSCFARRLWREAALHLGSLADHADAGRHAAAVAAGLVHAAVAEVRALRPGNAEKHYEAAVRLDPTCAAAWHALGELARERRDLERAAECLEREAIATTVPRDRLRLFDALGDLALDVLGDPVRAERCWAEVAAFAGAAVLTKLLALQRARGSTAQRGETCERLATLQPATAKALLEEAARAFVDGGDLVRAAAVAETLVAAYPLDVDTVACASAVRSAAGDFAGAAALLRRALAAGDRAAGDPRRAELWRRLGDAHRGCDDEPAALVAYQSAIDGAPRSEAAFAARRAVVELAARAGRDSRSPLAALVEADQHPAEVLAWARELARLDQLDHACAAYELAGVLDAPFDDDDLAFIALHPARVMASDEAYGATLDAADRRALIDDAGDAPLGDLLDLLAEASALVCPDARTALAQLDLADAKRISAASDVATAALYPQIANALGGPQTLLYSTVRATQEVVVVLSAPPVVVIGSQLAAIRPRTDADVEPGSDAELRFALGRIVELARPRRVFAAGLAGLDFAQRVAALGHAFGRPLAEPARAVAAEADRLRTTLPVAIRRRLTERLATFGPEALDAAAYRAACERAADRAGLLACGRVDVAIACAGGPIVARHLVKLAATEGYLAARRQLRSRRAS